MLAKTFVIVTTLISALSAISIPPRVIKRNLPDLETEIKISWTVVHEEQPRSLDNINVTDWSALTDHTEEVMLKTKNSDWISEEWKQRMKWIFQNGEIITGQHPVALSNENSTIWWKGQIKNKGTGKCLEFVEESLHCPEYPLHAAGRIVSRECASESDQQKFYVYAGNVTKYQQDEGIINRVYKDSRWIIPYKLADRPAAALEINRHPEDKCHIQWGAYDSMRNDTSFPFHWGLQLDPRPYVMVPRPKKGSGRPPVVTPRRMYFGWSYNAWHIPNFYIHDG